MFQTAELLENIMLRVPRQTILACQRVSRQFRDIVTTSTKLQQKLWYKTSGASPEIWTLPAQKFPYIRLPDSLRRHFRLRSKTPATASEDVLEYSISSPNPLLKRKSSPPGSLIEAEGDVLRFVLPALIAQAASWRSILLTDPPCYECLAYFAWPGDEKYADHRVEIAAAEGGRGITLGDVVEAVYGDQDEECRALMDGLGECGVEEFDEEGERFDEQYLAYLKKRKFGSVWIQLTMMLLPGEKERTEVAER